MQVAFFAPSAAPSVAPTAPPSTGDTATVSFDSILSASAAPAISGSPAGEVPAAPAPQPPAAEVGDAEFQAVEPWLMVPPLEPLPAPEVEDGGLPVWTEADAAMGTDPVDASTEAVPVTEGPGLKLLAGEPLPTAAVVPGVPTRPMHQAAATKTPAAPASGAPASVLPPSSGSAQPMTTETPPLPTQTAQFEEPSAESASAAAPQGESRPRRKTEETSREPLASEAVSLPVAAALAPIATATAPAPQQSGQVVATDSESVSASSAQKAAASAAGGNESGRPLPAFAAVATSARQLRRAAADSGRVSAAGENAAATPTTADAAAAQGTATNGLVTATGETAARDAGLSLPRRRMTTPADSSEVETVASTASAGKSSPVAVPDSSELPVAAPMLSAPAAGQPAASQSTGTTGSADTTDPMAVWSQADDALGAALQTSRTEPLAAPRRSASAASAAPNAARAGLASAVRLQNSVPGMRVSVSTEATSSTADTAAATAPANTQTSPILAAPTLVQVLVENGSNRSATPKGKTTDAKGATGVGTVVTSGLAGMRSALKDAQVMPASEWETATAMASAATSDTSATAEVPSGSDAATLAGGQTGGAGSRTAPEKLAGARGTSAQAPEAESSPLRERNFLDSDNQGVGASGLTAGTGIAKTAKNMSAHAPVPISASAALEVTEPSATLIAPTKTAVAEAARGSMPAETAGSSAAAAVRETIALAERAQEAGRNHVEVRVQTSTNESLRVHLRWHDGVIQTRFVTETTELQQALSREWERTQPQLADKGLRFGEASFERRDQQPSDHSSAQNAFTFDQQQQSSRGQKQAFAGAEEAATAQSTSVLRAATTAVRGGAATAAISPTQSPSAVAEVRNLRAWA